MPFVKRQTLHQSIMFNKARKLSILNAWERTLLVVSTLSLMSSPASAQSVFDQIEIEETKQSVASKWISDALKAVSSEEGESLGPTGSSRAYGILGTAMYDAWSAFDPAVSTLEADGYISFDALDIGLPATQANKTEAISYAAFTVLSDLFPTPSLVQGFEETLLSFGFDPDNNSSALSTAAGIGTSTAQSLLAWRQQDGSNQLNNYADTIGYLPINTSDERSVIDTWLTENIPVDTSPGDFDFEETQVPLHPQWGTITPFALDSGDEFRPVAPEPFLLDPAASLNLKDKTITRADGTEVAISKSLIGTDINPAFIEQSERLVKVSADLSTTPEGEKQKLIADFWEDPAGSPYPPGTWLRFAQKVAESENPDLDDDVKLFFALGNAVMDAGIATWEAKYFYDYARPIRVIRDLGDLGLIGEDTDGDGVYEIDAWAGRGLGTQRIDATDFLPYQRPNNPAPPFPEYTSGHSAFSGAAAEVLARYTGSDNIVLEDGTVGLSVDFLPGSSRIEPGTEPNEIVTLSWQTFSEASDEAGISRIYGGIHFDDGNLNSELLGRQVGDKVFERTQQLIRGDVASVPEPGMVMGLLIVSGWGYWRGRKR